MIPWEHVEARTRQPRQVSMWADLVDFGETCRRAYRRDVWNSQPVLIEAWLEKDAMSGIFAEATSAATFAGLVKLIAAGNIRAEDQVLIPITGSGLKEPLRAG